MRVERLELPRLAAPEPKSGVSTNFTIPADDFAGVFRPVQKQILFKTDIVQAELRPNEIMGSSAKSPDPADEPEFGGL